MSADIIYIRRVNSILKTSIYFDILPSYNKSVKIRNKTVRLANFKASNAEHRGSGTSYNTIIEALSKTHAHIHTCANYYRKFLLHVFNGHLTYTW